MVAAVADWRVEANAKGKIKKESGKEAPALKLVENPDILATVGHHPIRPRLVVGFAAETGNVVENARSKLARKGADIIVGNDVSIGTGVMGGSHNKVAIVSQDGVETWPEMTKEEVARRLARLIAERLHTIVF
jgi:phosphopantothenoylcysteine decarboxylase/phosphopantothenate--cysteine ligase